MVENQILSFESWESYEAFKAALPEGLAQGEYEAMIRAWCEREGV